MSDPTPQPESMRPASSPGVATATTDRSTLLVDTHVHLYGEIDRVLDAAEQRMAGVAGSLGRADRWVGCLMLTETARDHVFDALVGRGASHAWRPDGPPIGPAIWMKRTAERRLLVIAGGQSVTAERIEVLSLGTRERIADGQPLDATLAQALDVGALVVLPYGLGKWLGRRGVDTAEAFERWHARGIRLSDNAGRPRRFVRPKLFLRSAQLGLPVFAGSDPLRTGGCMTTAGCFGNVVSGVLDENNPAGSIKSLLLGMDRNARTFGRRVGLARCLCDQLALRVSKLGG